MLATLAQIFLIIAVLVLLEFVIEPKFRIRGKIVSKLGSFRTYILIIIVLVILDLLITNIFPSVNSNDIYKFSKLGLLIYFLPKKERNIK